MSELTEFLLARIVEDEEKYRAVAGDERYQHYAIYECQDGNEGYIVAEALRSLRECEAKRRIVKVARFAPAGADGWGFRRILKDLASVYADHPDYRDEWKP